MFKAIIFDLDGTLAYTIEDLKTGMKEMLSELGYPTRSSDEILRAVNYGSREFVRRCLPEDFNAEGEEFEICFNRYNYHYSKHYLDKTAPYEGISETLEMLKNEGFKLAVLSNKGHEHTVNLVSNIFRKGLFDIVLGNTSEFPTKPCPDSGLYIAKELGTLPKEVLYIGDSNIDMQTAKNCGFYACGVTWGYRDAEVLIQSGASTLLNETKEIAVIARLDR